MQQRSNRIVVWVAWIVFVLLAASSADASVDSELAYHRGVAAYNENRLEVAEGLFRSVLAEDAEDPSSLHYLALIEEKRGDTPASIVYYERAVAADRQSTELLVGLGAAQLQANRIEDAKETFRRVLEIEPGNGNAELYLGIAEYRQQNYRKSIDHMVRAAENDPSVRLQARYYVGLSQAFLGNLNSAVTAFSESARISPTGPLGKSAADLARQIQPDDRSWTLDAVVGVEYDSNPTFIGDTKLISSSGNTLKKDDDVLGVFMLNGSVSLLREDDYDLTAGYSGYLSKHDEQTKVDQQTHIGWASMGYNHRAFRFATRYDFAYSDLDLDDGFRRLNRLTPSVTYTNEKFGLTQLIYQFQDFRYEFDNPDRIVVPGIGTLSADPDGESHLIGLTQFYFLPYEYLTYLRIGVAGEHTKTEGTEYDYDGIELAAGFGMLFPFDIRFDTLYRFLHRDYRNKGFFDPTKKREDDINRLNLDLAIPFAEHWEASLRGAFSFNDSNQSVYNINRHVVGAYLKYAF